MPRRSRAVSTPRPTSASVACAFTQDNVAATVKRWSHHRPQPRQRLVGTRRPVKPFLERLDHAQVIGPESSPRHGAHGCSENSPSFSTGHRCDPGRRHAIACSKQLAEVVHHDNAEADPASPQETAIKTAAVSELPLKGILSKRRWQSRPRMRYKSSFVLHAVSARARLSLSLCAQTL